MAVYVDTRYNSGTIVADRGNYWRYYGLQRDPFVAGIRDDEVCLLPRWERYCDLLRYLCQSSNVLLTVTGAKSSGKTIFSRQFIANYTEEMRICHLTGSLNLDVAHLTEALIKDFVLPAPVTLTLDEQLEEHLANLQRCSLPCLLIIDNAHRLPDETLRMLLYFIRQQSESQMRLHVVLFGESDLKNKLTVLSEQESEHELCHHIVLEPFSLEETKIYLKHRLTMATLPAALPLSSTNMARIYALAEGIPGRINAVARQFLIDAMNQRQLHFLVNFVRARKTLFLGGGVLFLAMVLLALLTARGSHYPITLPHFVHKNIPVAHVVVSNKPVPIAYVPVNTDIVFNADTINSYPMSPEVISLSAPAPEVAKPHAINRVSTPKHHVAPLVASNASGAYTVQLLGASNEEAVKAFVAAHHLANKATYTRGMRAGKDWYSLTYGHYQTRADAQAVLATLPGALRDLHPWVKEAGKEAKEPSATPVMVQGQPVVVIN